LLKKIFFILSTGNRVVLLNSFLSICSYDFTC